MNRMLVIGIGSLIMTDDGIGTRVVEAIQGKLQEPNVSVVIGETDVQFCMDEIQPNDILIIIDSMRQGKELGSVEVFSLQDACKSNRKLHSQHDFSLIDALSLHYPDIHGYLIGVEAAEIGFGFELSKKLQNCFNQICNDVFNTIIEIKEAAKRARYPFD